MSDVKVSLNDQDNVCPNDADVAAAACCVQRGSDWTMLLGGRVERRASSSSDWQRNQKKWRWLSVLQSELLWEQLHCQTQCQVHHHPCVILWIWQRISSGSGSALLLLCPSTQSLQTHWDSSTPSAPHSTTSSTSTWIWLCLFWFLQILNSYFCLSDGVLK